MIDHCSDFFSLFGLPDQGVKAVCTTRWRTTESNRIQDFNLAAQVGGDPNQVLANRSHLVRRFDLPREPIWLDQVHGRKIHQVSDPSLPAAVPLADGATTRLSREVLAVLTADCLPLVLSTLDGAQIAVVHAGWRGLASGIIEAAINCFKGAPVVAWIGPGIGPCHFEVGPELKSYFAPDLFAKGDRSDRFFLNLPQAAERALASVGVTKIKMSGICTVCSVKDFYSFRREGVTGRFATLVWREAR